MRTSDLAAALLRDYGLRAASIERHAGGFEADAFVVDGTWFVKVWRRDPPSNLGVLETLAERGLPVVPPVHTSDGRLTTPGFAVYPFVRGGPAPEEPALLASLLRRVHAITDIDLPRTSMHESCIEFLRAHGDHPWIADRRDELSAALERLEEVAGLARRTDVPHVLVHNDIYGDNLLVDDDLEVIAILDWDHACIAPREHDLWMLCDQEHPGALLTAYGATDLDATHLEFALLARALRDLAARVEGEVDRPGVDEWGFRRIGRIDEILRQLP